MSSFCKEIHQNWSKRRLESLKTADLVAGGCRAEHIGAKYSVPFNDVCKDLDTLHLEGMEASYLCLHIS